MPRNVDNCEGEKGGEREGRRERGERVIQPYIVHNVVRE